MKGQLGKRINTVGKVGRIISLVLIILLLVAEFAMSVMTATVAMLPHDAVSVTTSTNINVFLNGDVFHSIVGGLSKAVFDRSFTNVNPGSGFTTITMETSGYDASLNIKDVAMSFESGDLVPMILMVMLNAAGIIVCLFFFMALMKELSKADSPFTDGVVRKMRNFAISLLPAAVVSSVSETILSYMFSISRSVSMSLNPGPVVFALVIFMLTAIFRYGVQLQKESDETL